jgi:adenine-specific DNA-methyltransferase
MAVDVGIVTGLNEFFVLTEGEAAAWGLLGHTRPIVTRSGHLSGIAFTERDLRANAARQLPSRLLSLPDVPLDRLPEAVRNYVLGGERQGFHKGYKCRIRDHWYVVPSVWTPDAFMLRQVHGFPKLVRNETSATSTDTIHRVRFVSKLPPRAIVAAFLNSLTFAFAEVMGRSYGGGVLELEPNEADALPLPLLGVEKLDFDTLHALVRDGDIDAALDITDRTLLVEGLGLSCQETTILRGAWQKLRDRRINRNHSKGFH